MSKIKLNYMPQLTLADVLRRRRETMKKFVNDSGVQSYEGLCNLCKVLGMLPPNKETYQLEIDPPFVTSQLDGIVVLDPPPVEIQDEDVQDSFDDDQQKHDDEKPTHVKRRRRRKKKEIPDEKPITESDSTNSKKQTQEQE